MPTEAAVKAEEALIHVLWINAGLSCDGDSVALTAATQPSIEEIALGALPGLPKVAVHWPLIDFECGPNGGADDFLEWFFKADRGELEPFVLVVEGSIPNEQLKNEGYWCGFGNNPATGQPMTTSEWLDRLGAQGDRDRRRGYLRDVRRHPRDGRQPDRSHGCARLSGLGLEEQGRHPDRLRARLPDPSGQPLRDADLSAVHGHRPGPDDSARRRAAAQVVVRCDRARGVRPSRLLRAGRLRHRVRVAEMHCETGLLGPGRQMQRAQARLDQRHRRLPERRRHLHRLHDARLPGQVHAVHGRTAGRQALHHRVRPVRLGDPQPAPHHRTHRRQGAELAAPRHQTRTPARPAPGRCGLFCRAAALSP